MSIYANMKKEFLNLISNELLSSGFKQSSKMFYRRIPIGKQILSFGFLKNQSALRAVVNLAIRYDELEKTLCLVDGVVHNPRSATIGIELGNLSGTRTIMWLVNNSSITSLTVKKVLTETQKYGLPFFDEFSSVDKIFDVLIDDGYLGKKYCSSPHDRAKKALVAAYLLERQNLYDNLIDSKVMFLQSIGNPYVPDFLKFAFRLKAYFKHIQI